MASSPAFEIGGIPYYDELPSPPEEHPDITVVPTWMVPPHLKKKSWGWNPTWEGVENPNFGSFRHYAQVRTNESGQIIKVDFDLIRWNDGAIDGRTGLPSPGSVVAGIELVNGMYYVQSFWQWRNAAYDDEAYPVPESFEEPHEIEQYIANNTGVWMLTVPGGFAAFAGETTDSVAAREGMEESALQFLGIKTEKVCANRANVTTLVRVGYANFERLERATPTETDEKLLGQFAVRIDAFRTSDALVGEAIRFAREELNLISPGPTNA